MKKQEWKITSLNLNGIRSAVKKGLIDWLSIEQPDCMCVQELKAQENDIGKEKLENLAGMQGYFHTARKKGYSGVGIYTRHLPSKVIQGFDGGEFDDEGRMIELQFDEGEKKRSIISVYFPSGSSGNERQTAKYRFLDKVTPYLKEKARGRDVILCGDLNIAHTEKDLKNWKGNLKNSGFLPEERAWLSGFIQSGWTDAYRKLHPYSEAECYTWWSNRGAAYEKNVGWRIDYQLVTQGLKEAIQEVSIYKNEKFSDHAPVTVLYQM